IIFATQPLGRQPWLDLRQYDRWRIGRPAKHVVLARGCGFMAALAGGEDRIGAGKDPRAVRLERVERTGGGKALDDALVDRARVHAGGKIRKRRELPVAARFDDQFDGLLADALERRKRIKDRAVCDLEHGAGAVDIRGLDLDAEPLRLGAKFGELVSV